MDKLLALRSSKRHYRADMCLVWCFDDRFTALREAFTRSLGATHVDLIEVAGGAMGLARAGSGRAFVLEQIRLSCQLHRTRRVALMLHMDCGGYGGSKSFAGREVEREHHVRELEKAANTVRKHVPAVKVGCYLADFGGIWEL